MFYEAQLKQLGLNPTQIDNVLSKLSVRDIEKFISKFKNNRNRNEVFVKETTPYQDRYIPKTSSKISNDEFQNRYNTETQARSEMNIEEISIQFFGRPENEYHELNDLEKKYRQLALKLHPDRLGGDAKPFHLLQKSFEYTKSKIPEFVEDKRKKRYEQKFENVAPPTDDLFDNKFDNSLFNAHFEKNSFKEKKIGHAAWLKNQKDISQGPRPSESNFNSVFENHKKESIKNMTPNQLQLIKTNQLPQELVHQKGTLIGGEDSDEDQIDFTGVCENSKLQFTDVRKALEVTHLIDTSDVQEFNVKNRFAERQSQTNVERMTEKDHELFAEQQRILREKEENRKYRAMIHDENVDKYFLATQSNRLTYNT